MPAKIQAVETVRASHVLPCAYGTHVTGTWLHACCKHRWGCTTAAAVHPPSRRVFPWARWTSPLPLQTSSPRTTWLRVTGAISSCIPLPCAWPYGRCASLFHVHGLMAGAHPSSMCMSVWCMCAFPHGRLVRIPTLAASALGGSWAAWHHVASSGGGVCSLCEHPRVHSCQLATPRATRVGVACLCHTVC